MSRAVRILECHAASRWSVNALTAVSKSVRIVGWSVAGIHFAVSATIITSCIRAQESLSRASALRSRAAVLGSPANQADTPEDMWTEVQMALSLSISCGCGGL